MNPCIPYSPFEANGLDYGDARRIAQDLANVSGLMNQYGAEQANRANQLNALANQTPFGGHVSHTPSGDDLPRLGAGGSRLGAWWLRVRLLFIDTRNSRRPLAPLLLRSGALRRVV